MSRHVALSFPKPFRVVENVAENLQHAQRRKTVPGAASVVENLAFSNG
jgi:hypothetical protein